MAQEQETVTIAAEEYRRLQRVRSRAAVCRGAQARYFKSRTRADLIAAKDAEQRLDATLRELDREDQKSRETADLFAEG